MSKSFEKREAERNKVKDAMYLLEKHNLWRRSTGSEGMCNASELGKAIDTIINHLKSTL